ncbi:FAD-dependent oxidoreductase family protein [Trifolium repens]|nr:FAD-dependent oxidoreductase family protein [Trifolium repens]
MNMAILHQSHCSINFSSIHHHSSSLTKKRSSLSYKYKFPATRNRMMARSSFSSDNDDKVFDVVIVGAGIIGLTVARQFLMDSDLSVAIIDKGVPCSGATGAGQGYLWMTHKTPGSPTWDLSMRSHQLWTMLADNLQEQGLDPMVELGWKKTGSLLVGRTREESDMLKVRAKQLSEAGLIAEYLSSSDLSKREPDLLVDKDTSAAFLPDDCQLDAHRTVAYIEKGNRNFASKGRYAEFYDDPVKCFIRSNSNGGVETVQTSKTMLYSKKAIIVAAGCWTGSLMKDLFRNWGMEFHVPVRPRKGHLLALENFNSLQLNHGLMEAGYVDHRSISGLESSDHGRDLSVSMTATTDAAGNLLIGSSREFVGFDTDLDESVISHIWKRVGEYFPKLRSLSLSDISESRKVRIGLRPYMPDGKPVIGPVPGLSNVYLAAGHEGGGLSMALGTAEMVVDVVLGRPGNVDSTPFVVDRVLE